MNTALFNSSLFSWLSVIDLDRGRCQRRMQVNKNMGRWICMTALESMSAVNAQFEPWFASGAWVKEQLHTHDHERTHPCTYMSYTLNLKRRYFINRHVHCIKSLNNLQLISYTVRCQSDDCINKIILFAMLVIGLADVYMNRLSAGRYADIVWKTCSV